MTKDRGQYMHLHVAPQGKGDAMEWQPIETAPLDGTAFVLLFKHDIRNGRYDDDLALWIARSRNGDAWWMDTKHPPIAWMPLPEPPKGGGE